MTGAPGEDAIDGIKVDARGPPLRLRPGRAVGASPPTAVTWARSSTPRHVHNMAWGGDDRQTLYLCARDRLYRMRLNDCRRRRRARRFRRAIVGAPLDRKLSDHDRRRTPPRRGPARARPTGSAGGRTSATAPGARCARTTARTARPGSTCRTITRARAPIAGTRTASRGDLRSPSGAVPRAGAVERARSDPQGAAVRPHRQRGQPRRGRQGVLLLPRLHADPLVHADALQVSAGARFPTPTLVDENRRRGRDAPEYELIDTGVFDGDRYFDVFVEYAKVDAEDLLMRITVDEPRPRGGADPRAADDLVPQHVVVERRRTPARACSSRRQPRRQRRGACAAETHALRPALALLPTATPDAAVHRERDQRDAAVRRRPAPRVRQGRHQRLRRPRRARRGEPGAHRHQGGRALRADGRRRRHRSPCACASRRAVPTDCADARRRSTDFDATFAQRASAKPTSSTPRSSRRRCPTTPRAVMRQSLAGMLWSKQFYHYVVKDWLDGDPAQPAPPPERQRGRNAQWAHLLQRRRHLDAGQVGVSRGTPRGTWRSTACRSRWSTPSSPRSSSC